MRTRLDVTACLVGTRRSASAVNYALLIRGTLFLCRCASIIFFHIFFSAECLNTGDTDPTDALFAGDDNIYRRNILVEMKQGEEPGPGDETIEIWGIKYKKVPDRQ